MQLAFNIDTREVQRASNVNEGLSKFTSGIGIILTLLLLPILLLFLAIGYFFSIKTTKELKRAVAQLKEMAGKHKLEDRPDLKELFLFTDKWLNKHREDVSYIRAEDDVLFGGFKREYLQLYSLMEEIHQSLHDSLYVDASFHSSSEEEIEDYSDFFGPDEDYEEDTFLQLNKNALVQSR